MKGHLHAGRQRPGMAAGVVSTTAVHAVAAVAFLVGVSARPTLPPTYAVELVAAPVPTPSPRRRAPEATPRPEPPVESPPAPPKPKAKTPDAAPAQPTPPPEAKTEPAPKTVAPEPPLPGERPSTGTAPANVSTPGLTFAYPEYLQNIVAQVYRRWDRPQTDAPLKAEIFFTILRDGTVREIRFITRSGNFSFDLGAQGAIEAAGNAGAFGPLPDGFPEDVLPVSFFFTPRRQ